MAIEGELGWQSPFGRKLRRVGLKKSHEWCRSGSLIDSKKRQCNSRLRPGLIDAGDVAERRREKGRRRMTEPASHAMQSRSSVAIEDRERAQVREWRPNTARTNRTSKRDEDRRVASPVNRQIDPETAEGKENPKRGDLLEPALVLRPMRIQLRV